MKKKLCCLVLAGLMLILLPGCGASRQVKTFDKCCEYIDKMGGNSVTEYEYNFEKRCELSDMYGDQLYDRLEKLGFFTRRISSDEQMILLSQDFIDEYLKAHTPEELLSNSLKVYQFVTLFPERGDIVSWKRGKNIDGEYWHERSYEYSYSNCACSSLTNLMNLVFDTVDTPVIKFDVSMENQDGFYKEYPEADPQPFSNIVTGKFYNRDGTNVRYEERTETGTVWHYGDFAILHKYLPHYSEGRYGWINGVFYDELPHWSVYQIYELYYKGTKILDEDTFEAIVAADVRIMEVDGKLYRVSEKSVDALYHNFHSFIFIEEISP